MYPVGISHPPRGRTVDWKTRICVVMFAGGWFALTVTSAVSAQEAVDQNKAGGTGNAVVEAEQHKAAAEAEDTDAAEAGASERSRNQPMPRNSLRSKRTRGSSQSNPSRRRFSKSAARLASPAHGLPDESAGPPSSGQKWTPSDPQTGGASCATFKDSRPP